ncbi:MAG: electron transport complex subunit RsxC [Candidatus Saganbacteria bacterium]|nr:electron transport complex subunit RsxC [Candidatus Saganbacteria bacterium]
MLFKNTFVGGIHPPEEKEFTEKLGIEEATLPKQVVIPLHQCTGFPYRSLVAKGDLVKVGQKIGDSDSAISAPVHTGISGKVVAVEPRLTFMGRMVESVVIDSDGKQDVSDSVKPHPVIEKISIQEIVEAVKNAGIVGLGGAVFPTHIKLSPPKEKRIDNLIVNGAECEPYLTCDYRLMLDDIFNLAYGIDIARKVLGVSKAYIGIEDNKPVAIDYLRKKLNRVEVRALKTKYPQGGEKQLIKTILNREVPSGGLPMDVGVMVLNVATCAQIAKTLKTGMPMIDRVVTVTGKYLRNPANLRVKIGTLYRDLIEECGGVDGTIRKVLCGGPMMGVAVPSLDIPVHKGTSGIVVFTQKEIDEMERDRYEEVCVRCGRCTEVCPVYLNPSLLADYAEKGDWEMCKKLNAMDCIECGACSFVCGSRRDIVQLIKLAKDNIRKHVK